MRHCLKSSEKLVISKPPPSESLGLLTQADAIYTMLVTQILCENNTRKGTDTIYTVLHVWRKVDTTSMLVSWEQQLIGIGRENERSTRCWWESDCQCPECYNRVYQQNWKYLLDEYYDSGVALYYFYLTFMLWKGQAVKINGNLPVFCHKQRTTHIFWSVFHSVVAFAQTETEERKSSRESQGLK